MGNAKSLQFVKEQSEIVTAKDHTALKREVFETGVFRDELKSTASTTRRTSRLEYVNELSPVSEKEFFSDAMSKIVVDSNANFDLPRLKSMASLSIASPDPEIINFSKSDGWDLGNVGARRYENSLGKFSKKSTTLGFGVLLCTSFREYHSKREKIMQYKIDLKEYDEKWQKDAIRVRSLLKGLDKSKYYSKVEHIGSTSIPNMVAKPIIDMMITINNPDDFIPAIDEFLREQSKIKDALPIKIGFIDKSPFTEDDWGFFQVPNCSAAKSRLCETNIHIFAKNTQSALEKTLFRDFLISDKGADLRKEYCDLKRQLVVELEKGLRVSEYALRKNKIVGQILNQAQKWSLRTDEGKIASSIASRDMVINPVRRHHTTKAYVGFK